MGRSKCLNCRCFALSHSLRKNSMRMQCEIRKIRILKYYSYVICNRGFHISPWRMSVYALDYFNQYLCHVLHILINLACPIMIVNFLKTSKWWAKQCIICMCAEIWFQLKIRFFSNLVVIDHIPIDFIQFFGHWYFAKPIPL